MVGSKVSEQERKGERGRRDVLEDIHPYDPTDDYDECRNRKGYWVTIDPFR